MLGKQTLKKYVNSYDIDIMLTFAIFFCYFDVLSIKLKEKHEQKQQEKWENSTTAMKERKPHHIMNTDTKTMTRREQVVISRLRTGYTRATHSAVMDKEPSRECPFCAVNLTTDHILWHCKETETKRLQMDIGKEIWKSGKQEMEKLIKYLKEIGFYDGI
jgi:hypothetical protein